MSFPVQKGILQSSERVTWNTADSLGRGATAIVYLGREKANGHVVAVKLFHEHIRMVAGGEEVRELELLQRLKHENIIRLFAIERELSKRVVLIMEYCEGGSLYHMLDQPQYVYGLPEEEFLLVLKDVDCVPRSEYIVTSFVHVVIPADSTTAGMQYLRQQGIIHRDIKPGNIMRFITEEGRSVYKLTDFGAARELHEEENFTSLYGTEEYLHPGMYRRAVLRLPTGQSFDAKVDLWSLGVTFFHVATGDLPFKPYGGRNNKQKMYEIISQKASGVISGVQNFDKGPIKWSRDLPPTCALSSGIKKLVVPMLAGLLEVNDGYSYDMFFQIVNDIQHRITISVFHPTSCNLLKVLVNNNDTYSSLQESVASLTDIPSHEQLLLHSGKLFEEVIDPTAPVDSYPLHVLQSTVFLYQTDMKAEDRENLSHPHIPPVPEFTNIVDMEKDLRVAHSCSSRAHLIKYYTERTVKKQELLCQAELCLRMYLQFRLKCTGERFLTMAHLLEESKKRFQSFFAMVEMIKAFLHLLNCPDRLLDDILKDKTLLTVHMKAESRTREIVTYRSALVERLDQEEARMKKWCARCKDTDCVGKVSHLLSVITSIQSRFRRDKNVKNEMSQHDQHIHSCERQRLQTQCVAISSILQDHCFKNLDIMYSDSIDFFAALSRNLNRIVKIEKNIESVIECQQLLSKKLDKTEEKLNSKEVLKRAQESVSWSQRSTIHVAEPIHHASTESAMSHLKSPDTGYGTQSRSVEVQSAASNFPDRGDPSLFLSTSDISHELRSMMEESMQIAALVEENTEIIKRFEECALQSSGSLSRNLSQSVANRTSSQGDISILQ